MKNYDHIEKLETIRTDFENKTKELDELLSFFENHRQDFANLMEYYYSEQRNQDLHDDEQGLIPADMKRGILSQDELYDLYSDYHDLSVRMLELGTNFFKIN